MKLQHEDRVKRTRCVSDEELAECFPRVQRLAKRLARTNAPLGMDVNDLISAGVQGLMNAAYNFDAEHLELASAKISNDSSTPVFWFCAKRRVQGAMTHEILLFLRDAHFTRMPSWEDERRESTLENLGNYALAPFSGKELKGPSRELYAADFIFAVIGETAQPGSVRDAMLKALIDLLEPRYSLILKLFYFKNISGRNIGKRLSCTRSVIEKQRDLALCQIRRKVLPIAAAELLCKARHKCSTIAKLEMERANVALNLIVINTPVKLTVSMLVRILTALADYRAGYTLDALTLASNYKEKKGGGAPPWLSSTVRLLLEAGMVETLGRTIRITDAGLCELENVKETAELWRIDPIACVA